MLLIRSLLICFSCLPPAVAQSFAPVDTADREAVRLFYHQHYVVSEDAQPHWTGDLFAGDAGTTTPTFKAEVLRRVNWFRAMAGLPGTIVFDTELSRKAQDGAMMLSSNGEISHNPPTTWTNYTADGAEACRNSNVAVGDMGTAAMTAYVRDAGSNNGPVAHRRWILYPPGRVMGTGDVPVNGGRLAANALWVAGSFGTRPPTRDGFVAWPPPGHVPHPLIFDRWSFSIPGADFKSTTISMTTDGTNRTVTLESLSSGYGDNTIVWVPAPPPVSTNPPPAIPRPDTVHRVTLENVVVGGKASTYSYEVVAFDTAAPPRLAPPVPRWSQDYRSRSVPAVAGSGAALVVGFERMRAFGLDSGEIRWSTPLPGTIQAPCLGADGTVYTSSAASPGRIAALDPITGTEQWSVPVPAQVQASPAFSDGRLYFGTSVIMSNWVSSTHGRAYALDVATRTFLWQYPAGATILTPAVIDANGRVFFTTAFQEEGFDILEAGSCLALDRETGAFLWRTPTEGPVRAAPLVGLSGDVYVATLSGVVHSLDATTGAIRWTVHLGGQCQSASPTLSQSGILYVGTLEGRLSAIRATDGTLLWNRNLEDRINVSLAVDRDGRVYAGTENGRVFAFDGATGGLEWYYDAGGILSDGGLTLTSSGDLLLGTDDRSVNIPGEGFVKVALGRVIALPTGGVPSRFGWPTFGQNERLTGQAPVPLSVRWEEPGSRLEISAPLGTEGWIQSSANLDVWSNWRRWTQDVSKVTVDLPGVVNPSFIRLSAEP